jgi:predicted transcriptional regulator
VERRAQAREAQRRRGKLSEAKLAEIDAAVADEVRSMRELREALGLTQADLAKLANMTQSDVSKFEKRDDHKISNVREMVEALGGELEVVAVFRGKRVRVA